MASYTLRYGRSYEEWCEEKAKRIRYCLQTFYESGSPVDIQKLAEVVYRERLSRASKLSWMPIQNRLTDFRPSPFIKSFLTYLIDKLVEDGYITYDGLVLNVPSLDYLKRLCTWELSLT